MRSISTHLAALGIAGLVTAGALTPATAQTWSTWNNGWNGGYDGPFVSADVGLGYGAYGYTAGYPAYGAPAYGGGVMIQAPVAGTVDSGFYAPQYPAFLAATSWNTFQAKMVKGRSIIGVPFERRGDRLHG